MTPLSGKTAVVTGASRGMGRASAIALAKVGAQVLVHYGRAREQQHPWSLYLRYVNLHKYGEETGTSTASDEFA